jgi:RND family efflux transporter MFP subunit
MTSVGRTPPTLWAVVAMIAIAFAFAGCRGDAGGQAAGPGGPGMKGPRGPQATPVRVAEVRTGAIEARTGYVAETRPKADVRLSAEISGIVEAVHVDLGDRVEAGQLLARVRGQTFVQAVREAQASLAHGEAATLRATVDLELAERERERGARLVERGALTRAEFEAIDGRYRLAQAALELARAESQQRQARLDRARVDLSNTRVEAPFSGAIAERSVEPGALIGPGNPLFRMVDTGAIVVRFSAPEADVARLAVGQAVEVAFDAVGGPPLTGRIDRIAPLVDAQTRTTPVEVVLEAADGVRPGMFARVTAVLETRDDVPLVPTPALVRRQLDGETESTEGVFIVRGETAHFVPVEVGLRSRQQIEIRRGAEPGEKVVVAGHSDLRDGAVVNVVDGERAGGRGGAPEARRDGAKGRQEG